MTNTPRYTYDGHSIYWTIYDHGQKLATVMTQPDAKTLTDTLQEQDERINELEILIDATLEDFNE